MEKIGADPRPLALPVQPDSPGTVVEMIISYHHIDRGVQFDPADLRPRKVSLIVDMMDMIVFYKREHATQIPNDPRLPAIMDVTVSYDMRTYGILAPSVQLRDERAVALGLCAVLVFVFQPLVVIPLLPVFTQGYAGTF